MHIALIAHDEKKADMVNFATAYSEILQHHTLYATGTTGKRISEATGLPIHRFRSGPLGGDQEIGALVARNKMDAIFFFRDPLTAQPHEPDITALIRLADVYQIPLATNMGTAELMIQSIAHNGGQWRELVNGKEIEHD